MGNVTDRSSMIFYASGGNSGNTQIIYSLKTNRNNGTAIASLIQGRAYSMWQVDGKMGGVGSTPTVAEIPTRSTTGAIGQANPPTGKQLWLINVSEAHTTTRNTFMLYDRLAQIGGLSGTSTSAQTCSLSTDRYTANAAAYQGNEIYVEIYTQIGASSTTITASYQDENNAAQTTQAVAIGNTGFREIYRMIKLPLASGTRGVRTVNSVTLAATTGTAGNFGVTIARPIWSVGDGGASQTGYIRSMLQSPGPQEIMSNACLAWMSPNIGGAWDVNQSFRLHMVAM